MDASARRAFLSALQRMFEDNVLPYRRAAVSFDREVQREHAETEWWSQFLPGHEGEAATVEVEPPGRGALHIAYAPMPDGAPAPGEIVWTWAPTAHGGRGAYSPVLIVGMRHPDGCYGVRMTTVSHEGEHRFFPIGAGPRDSRGRLSWVDLDQVLVVTPEGMHRERFVLDRGHFVRVADELYGRYGWPMADEVED